MISVSDVSLSFGKQVLFKDVNIKFTPGNCYGVIGANGSGKSTFLKILSGEIEADTGDIILGPGQRMAVLKQDQFAYDEYTVMDTVIMGHKKLYDVMTEKNNLYAKPDFSEEDGIRAAELEGDFAELGGWEAESEAGILLAGLGVPESAQQELMGDLELGVKVRVLLAQALFGNPDILLLDEPTNNLDLETIQWLEDFLSKFENTVIVVSHDRHFLNQVCTHIADIDYGKIQLYVGNYDFWYHASQLASKQMRDDKRKREDKIAELKSFIQRFSSNAAKSKQATSRKKLIEKLTVDDIKPSSRKFPYVGFKPMRECGRNILEVEDLSYEDEEGLVLPKFDFTVDKGDKIAFVGPAHRAKSVFFDIISGKLEPTTGSYSWGGTITNSYFPRDPGEYFESELSIMDWLRQYSKEDDDTYVRSFLGRMLFTGEESLKPVNVLSGGEKVRCMLSKMMQSEANVLIMDDPTNHLDLEAITALNDGLIEFKEVIFFTSHDHQFVSTIANRIVEFTPTGVIDRRMPFEDYLASEDIKKLRDEMYEGVHTSLLI